MMAYLFFVHIWKDVFFYTHPEKKNSFFMYDADFLLHLN